MVQKIAYIAGKYTEETNKAIQQNIDLAEQVGKAVLHQYGFIPVIPHKLFSMWQDDPQFNHISHQDWMDKVCLPLLDRCDAVVMCPGWATSKGSCMEYDFALAHGKEIIHYTE